MEPEYPETGGALSFCQKFFRAVLPGRWYRAMRNESQGWRLVCSECGYSLSVWEAGGIRFGAAGRPKRGMWCPQCRQVRSFNSVWQPKEEEVREGS